MLGPPPGCDLHTEENERYTSSDKLYIYESNNYSTSWRICTTYVRIPCPLNIIEWKNSFAPSVFGSRGFPFLVYDELNTTLSCKFLSSVSLSISWCFCSFSPFVLFHFVFRSGCLNLSSFDIPQGVRVRCRPRNIHHGRSESINPSFLAGCAFCIPPPPNNALGVTLSLGCFYLLRLHRFSRILFFPPFRGTHGRQGTILRVLLAGVCVSFRACLSALALRPFSPAGSPPACRGRRPSPRC